MVENKTEGFVAQAPEIILRSLLYVPSIHPDRSRITRLEESKVIHEKISPRVVGTAELVERSGRKRERNFAKGSLVALVPIASLAAKVLARKDHFRR